MDNSRVNSNGTGAPAKGAAIRVQECDAESPTFVVFFNVALTAAKDLVSLVAGAAKVLRLRRVVLVNPGNATAAAIVDLELGVAAAVGSGGAAGNVRVADAGARVGGVSGGPDSAAGVVARVGDTTQAASFVPIIDKLAAVGVPTAAAASDPKVLYEWKPGWKPPTVTGDTIPLVLRSPIVGAGAANLRGYVEFTVDDA